MPEEPTERRESSFDELAIGLASGSISRGRALRLMGAALVGGALGSLGMREATADQCKRNGKACKKDAQCCSGNCEGGSCADAPPACGANGATCTADTQCCSGICESGSCRSCRIASTCASDSECCTGGFCNPTFGVCVF